MFKRRGEITSLSKLFDKYKNTLIAPQKTIELETLRVVGELLGVKLKESQISYTVSTRTVNITASGMLKQEIKINNKEILSELKKRLGLKNSPKEII